MQATDSQAQLKDPTLYLPLETLCQLLLCLEPSSIARTSAISKRWRFIINSNPVLHQHVELTDGWIKYLQDVVVTFHRLSSLASNHLVTVDLNLTRLFVAFNQNTKEKESNGFVRILETLNSSSTSLKHLTIEVKAHQGWPVDKYQKSDRTFTFFAPLMKQVQAYKRLETFKIRAPFHFSIATGDGGSIQSKRFALEDNVPNTLDRPQKSDLSFTKAFPFIRKVKKISGNPLIEFRLLNLDFDSLNGEKTGRILKEVLLDKDNLQVLDLIRFPYVFSTIGSLRFWELARMMPNLEVFTYRDSSEGFRQGETPSNTLPPLEFNRTRSLKRFDLILSNWFHEESCWEMVSNWIGNELETFGLGRPRLSGGMGLGGNLFISVQSLSSIILNSRNTLRVMKFKGLGRSSDTLMAEISFSLPNLVDLEVEQLSPSVSSFLSGLVAPKLEVFKMDHRPRSSKASDNQVDFDPAFECFVKILKNCQSSINRIYLRWDNYFWTDRHLPETDLSLSFPNLAELKLFTYWERSRIPDPFVGFYSRFNCPKLVKFSCGLAQAREITSKLRETAPNLPEYVPP